MSDKTFLEIISTVKENISVRITFDLNSGGKGQGVEGGVKDQWFQFL